MQRCRSLLERGSFLSPWNLADKRLIGLQLATSSNLDFKLRRYRHASLLFPIADNGASAIQLPRRLGLVAAEKINDVFRCHGSSICLNAEWSKVFCFMVINKTYGCIKFNLIRRKKTFD